MESDSRRSTGPELSAEKAAEPAARPGQSQALFNVSGDGVGELSERRNTILADRIVAYCVAKKASVVMSSDADELKIPGTGTDIYWVYTADEMKVVATIDCDNDTAQLIVS